MFFAAAPSSLRPSAYANAGRPAQRFLDDALFNARQQACAYSQDESSFTLTLDVPGIARDQLEIAIEGAVVRVQSAQGATRRYRAAYELPQEIDTSLSEAKLENGVLTLKLSKLVPVSKATRLTIN